MPDIRLRRICAHIPLDQVLEAFDFLLLGFKELLLALEALFFLTAEVRVVSLVNGQLLKLELSDGIDDGI